MLPACLHLSCKYFPKKTNELEINKKKSCEVWGNKSRKVVIDMKDARHKARGTCKARQHLGHKHVRRKKTKSSMHVRLEIT